jgi:hypothetical protein
LVPYVLNISLSQKLNGFKEKALLKKVKKTRPGYTIKMDKSYIAGMYDGDGSIVVGKVVGGYQLKVELTQCNLEFLKSVNEEFSGIGKIYMDKRVEKYRNECAGSLRFTGVKATPLLDLTAGLT